MQLIERAIVPTTSPVYRQPSALGYLALGQIVQQGEYHPGYIGGVGGRSINSLTCNEIYLGVQGDVVVIDGSVSVGTWISACGMNAVAIGGVADRLQTVWTSLNDALLIVTMHAATARTTLPVETIDYEQELRADAAFASFMTYVEPSEHEEDEPRGGLKYPSLR